jgi:hypothetical protein
MREAPKLIGGQLETGHCFFFASHAFGLEMWGSTQTAQEEDLPVKEAPRQRTPRQYPNIWPDMRPKPPPREIITNDEHFVETAAKLRVSVALPLPSTRPAE